MPPTPEPTREPALKPSTWVVSAGRPDEPGSPLNAPLVPASNFVLGEARAYSRDDATPAWEAFESIMGGLEGGTAVAFSSGMAASAALFECLGVGATVVLPTDCYAGVAGLAARGSSKRGWAVERLPAIDTDAWIERAARANMLWLESPTNPMLDVADLPAICAAERKPDALLVVDNTLATPLNQRPLELGADAVMHSATKYIGGHSDLLAGVVVVRDARLAAELRTIRELHGGTPGTLEVFLAMRGVRTLAVRLEASQRSALEIATRLGGVSVVRSVRYPGLKTDPGHETAARFMRGFGAVITFEVEDGAVADRVCQNVQVVRHATSLGAVESTMERRAAVPGQEHLPAGLLRLSVGCEDVDDLWRDLLGAIERALG